MLCARVAEDNKASDIVVLDMRAITPIFDYVVLPPGAGFEWTAMSYQEKIVGHQMYLVFAMALLLVYLVLAGQYESWFMPVAVLLARRSPRRSPRPAARWRPA